MSVAVCFLFFFYQKTAYLMRFSDWSSDVCSSDLLRFTGFRIDALADVGAFWNAVNATIVTSGAVRVFGHCYRIPGLLYRVRGVFTNAVPTDAYRGAGKPETVSTLERLIDVAADRLGIDRVELRRRNLVQPRS